MIIMIIINNNNKNNNNNNGISFKIKAKIAGRTEKDGTKMLK